MSSRINLANVILTPREWCVQKTTFKIYSRTYIFLLLDIALFCYMSSLISWVPCSIFHYLRILSDEERDTLF